MEVKKEWADALSKAKIHLMAKPDTVFFTTVCFSMKHVFDDTIPTACTDGYEVRYNPTFFMGLTPEERVFLLVHECMHPAYMHMQRVESYGWDRRKGNVAGDHVINLQLLDRGFKMPKCGLADPQYRGMSMEEVYKLLPDEPHCPIEDLVFGNGDPAVAKELEQHIQDVLTRAVIQSKMAGDKPGTIPGEIEIFLDKLLNPKLPWQKILRRELQSFSKNDFSWKKPNRRHFPKHHLPSLWSESLDEVVFAVDTSGSVSDDQSLQMVSDIHSVFKMFKPKKVTIIQFDTRIISVTKVRSMQELKAMKFTGRGGTRIDPVLEWLNKNRPQFALIFTDGGFNFSGLTSDVRISWLINDNPNWTSQFGKVIHYDS